MTRIIPTEAEIQAAIMEWLKWNKIFHWRNNTGAMIGEYKGKKRFMRFGVVGSPDLFALHEGKLYGIEVKRDGGKMSYAQHQFRHRLIAAGGKYILAFSVDDVDRGIETKENEN